MIGGDTQQTLRTVMGRLLQWREGEERDEIMRRVKDALAACGASRVSDLPLNQVGRYADLLTKIAEEFPPKEDPLLVAIAWWSNRLPLFEFTTTETGESAKVMLELILEAASRNREVSA